MKNIANIILTIKQYNMYILKDVNGNRIHYEFIPILKIYINC
jgi:hypothetical protein